MTDAEVAGAASGAQKSSSISQIATSPEISDSLAALTLSTSSDVKPQSFISPEISERLALWLEEELNVRQMFLLRLPPSWVAHVRLLFRPLHRASSAPVRHDAILHPTFDTIQVPKDPKSGEEGEDDCAGADDGKNMLFVKLLVSNAAAGSIIGKMGVNIHHTQETTGAKIQLSKPAQLYPGTNDRTLLIQGNLCQLASAVYTIFIRLIEEGCAPTWSCPTDEFDAKGYDMERTGRDGRAAQKQSRWSGLPGLSGLPGSSTSTTSTTSNASNELSSEASSGENAILTPGRQSADGRESKGLAGADDRGVDIGASDAMGKDSSDIKDEEDKEADSHSAANMEGRSCEDRKTGLDLPEYVAKAPLQVKLVIPEEFIGYIVGRSGVNVTNICTITHTSIKVFPQPATFNLTHQVLSIRGHLEDIIKAISMVVLKLADDSEYYGYAVIPHTYIRRPAHRSTMMPMYHPNPAALRYIGSDAMYSRVYSQNMHAMMGVPSHPSLATNTHVPGPGGQFVSMMVPLVPEQQSEILANMGTITQAIQSSTGVLLKLEATPGHAGFSVRLDGPREYVTMAINILLSQISYPTGDSYASASPPMSPPVPRDTPSPFNGQMTRWHSQSPE